MSTYGKFTAATGSIVLNVVVALALAQAAGAAMPASEAAIRNSHAYTIEVGTDQPRGHDHCALRIRTRAIVAVVLALIV
jgi:hypothetical protein